MDTNIYTTPESSLDTDTESLEYELATTWNRFFNMLIDTAGYYALAFLIGMALALSGYTHILETMNDYVFGLILFLVYYIPQEAIWGRTLGKLITGTKAVDIRNKKLSFGQVLGRTFMRFVPFEAFSFLGGNGHPRGWHDSVPKTKVIRVR